MSARRGQVTSRFALEDELYALYELKEPTWHHIVYRSHGGGDEPANPTSPCWPCHGDGIHQGRLRVTGRAPDGLVSTLGHRPWLEVRGREKRLYR